jgi:hypothetical protein
LQTATGPASQGSFLGNGHHGRLWLLFLQRVASAQLRRRSYRSSRGIAVGVNPDLLAAMKQMIPLGRADTPAEAGLSL